MKNLIFNNLFASLSFSERLKAFVTQFAFFAAILTVAAVNSSAVSPGAPDLTFGTRGFAKSIFGSIRATVIQADGKILVAGDDALITCNGCNINFKIARYNTNGTLDSGFGTNGVVVTDWSAPQNDSAFDIVVQADGKIIIAGSTPNDGTSEVTGFKLLRYMPNGALDTSYGTNGKVYEQFNELGGYVQSIFIQPDGKVVAAGTDRNSTLFVARFNMDGNVDSSFAANGKIVTNSYNVSQVKIARQSDGKIVIAAGKYTTSVSSETAKVIRYNANGTLDTSFGSGGVAASTFTYAANPVIAIQPDGKIILSAGGGNSPRLVRFNSDGSVDAGFAFQTGPATNGYCTSCTQKVGKILTLPDGRFYLVGNNSPVDTGYTRSFISISRYLSNGTFDSGFGFRGAGYIKVDSGTVSYSDVATNATLQTDGKIIIVGSGDSLPSTGGEFNFVVRVNTTITAGTARGDFDGDGKTDFAVFRPSNTYWYVLNSSSNSLFTARYGLTTDTITPGDYDYDGKNEFSVFRPSGKAWYVYSTQPSVTNYSTENFGQNGDVSAPEDYDGDGKTDIAVFRPSNGTWYIRYSSQVLQGVPVSGVRFGQDGDKPVAGDYDGDGRADIAVFRPSTGAWYIQRSSDNGFVGIQFGVSADRLVPADYDGDLKTDIAVYRDGFWYLLRSSDNGFFATQFGVASDKPVPGDYDGDGKADVAVYRPDAGSWYALKSSDGAFVGQQWGISEDVPAPGAFVR